MGEMRRQQTPDRIDVTAEFDPSRRRRLSKPSACELLT
jgi:hypothetical protein